MLAGLRKGRSRESQCPGLSGTRRGYIYQSSCLVGDRWMLQRLTVGRNHS